MNPMVEKQVTIIAPLKQIVLTNTITFRLRPELILQLTGSNIKNLTVDFGTGTTYNLITNTIVSSSNPTITFATSGLKEFEFTATYNDNETETLQATMLVNLPFTEPNTLTNRGDFPTEENFIDTAGITSTDLGNEPFQGYNETSPTKGRLEYRTYYNLVTNDGSVASKIKKEIIILDGFDPGDGRKIYDQSLGYLFEKSSIYELMGYDIDNNPNNDNNINLVEKLRRAPYGFDVTLVNFPNGTDYVERNAMTLVGLLNRENAKLALNGSSQKIAIVGPSMGGLVSRYALAYMEKNNIPHNTKLWVSFDSPHLGANIPLAAQENLYFYGYKGRNDKAKLKFDENFRSPAARQMLIEQLDYAQENAPYNIDLMQSGFIPSGANNNTRFRQLFQNNLNANGLSGSRGYPQNLRKVALINGTTNGTKTNIEGQMFLELAAFKKIRYGRVVGPFGFIISNNPLFLLATQLATNIKVATIEDRFLGYPNTLTQTFAGKATYFTGWNNNFPATINGTVIRFNENPRGTMDIVPGGLFNTQGIILKEFTDGLYESGIGDIQWRAYVPNHTFIPTVSALAFKNPNFDWSTAFNRNLVCDPANKEIEFDSYFSPKGNEEHVFVSYESANWLIKELTDNPQAPYFPLEENLLTGPNVVCENTNTTFSIIDICKTPSPVKYNTTAGVPVNGWSVEGNIVIVSSTPYTVIVKGIANGSGKIIATFQNGQFITKTIWVGKPSFTIKNSANVPSTVNVSLLSTTNGGDIYNQNITNIIWEKISNNPNNCGVLISVNGFSNEISYNGTFCSTIIKATAINSCGSTSVIKTVVGRFGSNDPLRTFNQNLFKIYPNPTSNFLNIELKDENLKPTINTKINAKLFDMNGEIKSNLTIINNIARIDVSSLPKGNYILKIDIDGITENHQVIVE